MIRFFVRIALTALVFMFVLPLIKGIDFHGSFGVAMVAALAIGIIGWLIDLLVLLIGAALTIGTLGLALLVLIPLWLLGFWILPAIALKVLADFMPTYLTVRGWVPAIEGGLVLFLLGIITSAPKRK
jgi:uncharacterized membrane protein YvlD (DUF360 family)